MQTRLFAGCLLTSEIKMHLRNSSAWHNAQLETNHLLTVPYESKEYLGRYLEKERHTLQDLKDLQFEINRTLATCSPELAGREFEIKLFTHTLVA